MKGLDWGWVETPQTPCPVTTYTLVFDQGRGVDQGTRRHWTSPVCMTAFLRNRARRIKLFRHQSTSKATHGHKCSPAEICHAFEATFMATWHPEFLVLFVIVRASKLPWRLERNFPENIASGQRVVLRQTRSFHKGGCQKSHSALYMER